MRKGLFRTILCIILALIMGLGSPLMSIAEEQDGLYLADLKIGYDDDGKASLIAKGYKVYNQNVNETGQGKAVYIGYKTTNKTEEAITDIATMNMNGRYSFDKYAKYVEEVIDAAEAAADKFYTAVSEFAAKFENGTATSKTSKMAKTALELINKYYDDDFADANDADANKIGNMIITGKMTKEILTKLFYQGNSENIMNIKKLIAFGLTETGTDTFLTRLKNYEYTDQLDPALANTRSDLLSKMDDIKEYLLTAQDYGEAAEEYPEGKEAYIASFESEEDQIEVAAFIRLYEETTEYQYGSNLVNADGNYFTLFDALTAISQEEYDALEDAGEDMNGIYPMDAYLVDILAKSLTAGQRASLDAVTIITLVANASTTKNSAVTSAIKEIMKEIEGCSDITIYAGVDRSLFDHPEDVALTASTIEEVNKGGENYIAKDIGFWEYNKAAKITFLTLGALALGVSIALLVNAFVRMAKTAGTKGLWVTDITALTPGDFAYPLSPMYQRATFFNFVGSAVAFAVAVIMLIVFLVLALVKPEPAKEFTYTKIPRALVHMIEGEENKKEYYNYYAVTRIDASEDDDDYMNVYGDLNGYSKTCQWECLYITKDSRCGKPLSANIEFITGEPDLSKNETNGYLPIHGFDDDVASNFNANTGSENPTAIYAYAKIAVEPTADEPTTTPNQGGSIFETNPVAMCLAALILGAGLSCGATLLITKKRRTA